MKQRQKAKTKRNRKQLCEKFHVLKATEGGKGQRVAMYQLKAAGIVCKADDSPYVGHTAVLVFGTKRDLNKAEKIVYGR